ncbi:MAG: GNAT family N-acetyltransferase, partial [Ardenticatenaceae bacterium]
DDYSQIIAQHTVSVIEEKGSIVGVVVLMEKEDGMLLDNVAVDPDYQGQGLGRQLIEWAHAEVHRRGFDQISLYTHEKMTQNIHIYQKLGYLESERRREYGYDRVYMKKYLKNH